MFNITFNIISVISWQSVLLVEETWVPGENHRPVASHWQTSDILEVHCTYHIHVYSNFFFQLFGGGIFGFGLWVLLDSVINKYVQASDELKTVLVIVHVFIVVGVSLLIFGIIGIYGAARPRRWALIMVIIN